MAILSTVVKDFIRQKTESGYITLKPKTDADCVKYIKSDGTETDVQTELNELNSNLEWKKADISKNSNNQITITMPDGWSEVNVLITPNQYYAIPCHLLNVFMKYGNLYTYGSSDVSAKLWCMNNNVLIVESVKYKDGVSYDTYVVDAYYR